jgi:hypothetical protein
MSITVKSIPSFGNYISAHNDMFFVVDSTNKAQPNFKYVFDVYIGFTLVTRIKVFPEPTYQYGVFNAGPVIRSYLRNTYFQGRDTVLNIVGANGNWEIAYTIKYGEEYGTPVTTYLNLDNSGSLKAYNYYNSLLTSGSVARLDDYPNSFLNTTGRPMINVSLADNYFVYFWNKDRIEKGVRIKKYFPGGALDTSTSTFTSDLELFELNVGPMACGVTSAHEYYTVEDTENAGTILTFKIDCFEKHPNQTLVFLNKLGGYETAFFRYKSRRTLDVDRKTFGLAGWDLLSSEGLVTYNNGTTNTLIGHKQVYAVTHNNRIKLASHLLNDTEWLYMKDLFASPQVYIELRSVTRHGAATVIMTEGFVDIITEDGQNILTEGGTTTYFTQNNATYVPVKFVPNSMDVRTNKADGLTSFEVEIELLQNYNSQFA